MQTAGFQFTSLLLRIPSPSRDGMRWSRNTTSITAAAAITGCPHQLPVWPSRPFSCRTRGQQSIHNKNWNGQPPAVSSPSSNTASGFYTPLLTTSATHTHNSQSPRSSAATTSFVPARTERLQRPEREEWQIQKKAVAAKLKGESWEPPKRVSPDAMDCIRALHDQFPDRMTTPVLAREFEISPEAVRRILRRRWSPNEQDESGRRDRWRRRGERIWKVWAGDGYKVPTAFRAVAGRPKRAEDKEDTDRERGSRSTHNSREG